MTLLIRPAARRLFRVEAALLIGSATESLSGAAAGDHADVIALLATEASFWGRAELVVVAAVRAARVLASVTDPVLALLVRVAAMSDAAAVLCLRAARPVPARQRRRAARRRAGRAAVTRRVLAGVRVIRARADARPGAADQGRGACRAGQARERNCGERACGDLERAAPRHWLRESSSQIIEGSWAQTTTLSLPGPPG
jgi:hypothetical protein